MSGILDVSSVKASIDAKVETEPTCISKFGKERIYQVKVSVKRKSGVIDEIFLNYSDTLRIILKKDMYISVEGDIRTKNKKNTDFVIQSVIYASKIVILNCEPDNYKNECIIKPAYLEKVKEVRKSYSDDKQDVAVYSIKLVRPHSRYSYFRCTSWGRDAIFLSSLKDKLNVKLEIRARLESHTNKSGKLDLGLAVYFVELLNK